MAKKKVPKSYIQTVKKVVNKGGGLRRANDIATRKSQGSKKK